jgi:hypothetical protein
MMAMFDDYDPVVMMMPSVIAHFGAGIVTMMVAAFDDDGFGAGN